MITSHTKTGSDASTISTIRRIVLGIFLIAALGAVAELTLLGHTEDWWQWVPLVLILFSLAWIVVQSVVRKAAVVRIFRLTMLLFVVSGFTGIVLHYKAKVEFKLEMNPDLAGRELFLEAIKGATVPPVLAPGMMIPLGLLGLAYTYRHPILGASNNKENK
jgi:hypothetical protein